MSIFYDDIFPTVSYYTDRPLNSYAEYDAYSNTNVSTRYGGETCAQDNGSVWRKETQLEAPQKKKIRMRNEMKETND